MNVVKFKGNSDLISDTLNTVFNSPLFKNREGSSSASDYSPKVRISENRENFNIKMELPGLNKNEVKLTVENNILSVSGSKKEEAKSEDTNLIINEIFYGEFKRDFNLSKDIKVEAIDAEFNDGVLNITLPKVEEAKPVVKEINIK